jgi:DegV family protein with EDD domain
MSQIHIVTDSGAVFSNPRTVQQFPLTIVPNKINIGGKLYREGVDLTHDEAMRLVATQRKPPEIVPPSVAELAAIYNQIARQHPAIVSIHTSRELSQSWQNAREAARQVSGTCEVAVVDSRTICVGQGMLARLGCQAALETDDFEAVVKAVRGASERIYSVFYVESLDYLRQNQIMSESRTLLAAVLSIKPFLSMEEGRLTVTEKVRTRSQATERLVEFLAEFDSLDDAAIIQSRPHISEQTRTLQDRFAVEFPGRHFPGTQYGASLAALVGTDATGVVILESEQEDYDEF